MGLINRFLQRKLDAALRYLVASERERVRLTRELEAALRENAALRAEQRPHVCQSCGGNPAGEPTDPLTRSSKQAPHKVPCGRCGVPWADHDASVLGHEYRFEEPSRYNSAGMGDELFAKGTLDRYESAPEPVRLVPVWCRNCRTFLHCSCPPDDFQGGR